MLEKKFTIFIVLGLCLGMILAGVRVSSMALDTALGAEKSAGLLSVEKGDSGAELRLLGNRYIIEAPSTGEITGIARSLPVKLEALIESIPAAGRLHLEKAKEYYHSPPL
ncbi:MAG: hypothetical protein ACYDEQ_01985 [Desulfocucumaceae bacterium]